MIIEDLQQNISNILQNEYNIAIDKDSIVTFSDGDMHGDLSSNVAMKYFKELTLSNSTVKTPFDFANQIAEKITIENIKIEVVKPGFINFSLEDVLISQLLDEMYQRDYSKSSYKPYQGKKIIVEYTDPNPLKMFHIGHLMTNAIGESISRLIEYGGGEVKRVCYQGDVGMHQAMTIWGMIEKFKEENMSLEELSTFDLKARIKYVGDCYANGASAYKTNPDDEDAIKDLNAFVYLAAQRRLIETENWKPLVDFKSKIKDLNRYDENYIYTLYFTARSWSLEYFEEIYKMLGTKFSDNGYYFESEMAEYGYKIVTENIKNGVFVEDDGAVIFPGNKMGLHNRVFINSQKLPTYEAKELGLTEKKYLDYPYDESYVITANEISEYFKVIKKVLSIIFPDLEKKTHHIAHGMMKLITGKMSSRSGKVIPVDVLIETVQQAIKNNSTDKKILDDDNYLNLAIGNIKFIILKNTINKDIIYDPNVETQLEGDNSIYVNYTYARSMSILNHSHVANEEASASPPKTMTWSDTARGVALTALKHDISADASVANLEPHLMCKYVLLLSQKFNTFYNSEKIIGSDFEKEYIKLCQVIVKILENSGYLLGFKLEPTI